MVATLVAAIHTRRRAVAAQREQQRQARRRRKPKPKPKEKEEAAIKPPAADRLVRRSSTKMMKQIIDLELDFFPAGWA